MPVRATPWLPILIVLLGLAAHAPARHSAFQFDDFPAVVENPALQTRFRLDDLLRPSAAGADYVRPVLFLTYRACDALAGVRTALDVEKGMALISAERNGGMDMMESNGRHS